MQQERNNVRARALRSFGAHRSERQVEQSARKRSADSAALFNVSDTYNRAGAAEEPARSRFDALCAE